MQGFYIEDIIFDLKWSLVAHNLKKSSKERIDNFKFNINLNLIKI